MTGFRPIRGPHNRCGHPTNAIRFGFLSVWPQFFPAPGDSVILHVDMDAFYASVEERDRPELAGRPLIVGGSPEGRGVVSAANYAVRRFGVHSAMPTATALRLCPHAILLPTRIDHYARVSAQIREILERYTPLVEPLSLDEAFLDVTGSTPLFGPAPEIARRIKREIAREVRLVASVGVAPTKFVAKIASDLHKPDALVVVEAEQVREFLDPLPIGRLWGVGRVTGNMLQRLGIQTIGQVRRLPEAELRGLLGQAGEHLWQLAQGHDPRPVVPDRESQSISNETTFPDDLDDFDVLRGWLRELAEQVGWRLRRSGGRGRTIQLKIRLADFSLITRSETLADATDLTERIYRVSERLLVNWWPGRRQRVRLLGIGLTGLERRPLVQKSLFPDEQERKFAQLDQVKDQIRDRFGRSALHRASGLQPPPPGNPESPDLPSRDPD